MSVGIFLGYTHDLANVGPEIKDTHHGGFCLRPGSPTSAKGDGWFCEVACAVACDCHAIYLPIGIDGGGGCGTSANGNGGGRGVSTPASGYFDGAYLDIG